jgi:hypothetical protein
MRVHQCLDTNKLRAIRRALGRAEEEMLNSLDDEHELGNVHNVGGIQRMRAGRRETSLDMKAGRKAGGSIFEQIKILIGFTQIVSSVLPK